MEFEPIEYALACFLGATLGVVFGEILFAKIFSSKNEKEVEDHEF